MPRNALKKLEYVNKLPAEVNEITDKFQSYRDTLVVLFGKIDGFIVDGDTPPAIKTVMETKRSNGLTLLSDMVEALGG